MSIGRRIGKEVVVHIHNGILLSYKKACIWVSSNEVDETGACYTEWSKPERETPMQYINAYIWNLERWEQRSYMQDSKRDTNVKNRLLDHVGEGKNETIWEKSIETCILSYVKQMTSASLIHEAEHKAGALGQPWGMGWRGRWQGVQDGGTHVYPWLIHVDVWQKTTTILQSN